MLSPLPLTRELVLIGGGHAHALVLKRWGMAPLPGARLTLVNPGPTAPYTGMLPGFVAGHYPREALEIDLVRLARFAGARLILGEADAIDRDRRRIHVAGRGEVANDIASIDIGITSSMPDLPGFAEHGVAAKPLGAFADRWARFLDDGTSGAVVVIGGGLAGGELALAMHHALSARGRRPDITVIEARRALSALGLRAQATFRAHLDAAGVRLLEGAQVAAVGPEGVTLADGTEVPAALTVGAAGARPYGWLQGTGLDLKDGFLVVDDRLRTSDPAIYAAGDCAHMPFAPRPKAGVFAVRAAPVLAHNLRADLSGGARRRFRPQGDYLKLVSLGGKAALAEKWGLALAGDWAWRWKDRIDRRFMEGLGTFPAMRPPALPRPAAKGLAEAVGPKPLCGGCGSKVGGAALAAVLSDLPRPLRDDIVSAPGDDAAILAMGGARQVISTDHLRAFTLDPWTMARIAAEHALGDIWSMGAAPQAALASIVLPRLSEAMQERWLAEIMDAATRAFSGAGAAIVGGHTTVGAELTIGFTVTGLCEAAPVTLAGARPGDRLILTRPIGSGTILAAEMLRMARGPDVAACLAEMARSQGPAAAILGTPHAMTDVTGFGLAGHLLNILDASGAGAQLWLDRVPLYEGAIALAAEGVRSTIYPANRAAALRVAAPDSPRGALLFDPQTAGGLLAACPGSTAEDTLHRLRSAGYDAAIIGEIVSGPVRVEVL